MKRLITLAISFLLCTSLFAQNAEYTKHVTKAKEYEENEQWIHALGEYWDAMEADSNNAKDAFKAWETISEAIKSGKPGTGEYDDFDAYDCWAELQEEYEDYWYEDCPLYFTFSDFEKGELDYETRTASYSTELKSNWTPKYLKIKEFVETGYKKAFRNDWKLIRDWPEYSCRKTGDRVFNDGHYYNYATYAESSYDYSTSSYILETNYAVQFSVIGDDDSKVLESFNARDNYVVTISGIDRKGIKAFDAKKVKIVPEKVIFLERTNEEYYDPITYRWLYKTTEKDLLKDTEILINTPDKTSIVPADVTEKLSLIYGNICKMVKVPGGSFSMGSSKGNYSEKPVHIVTVSSFEMGATEVTNELFEMVMGVSIENYYNDDHEESSKRPVNDCSWYKAIYFCNRLSEICGYTPCYKLDGESDTSKWSEDFKTHSADNYINIKGTITCDFSANGFRLPTEAEWEYAAVEGSKNSSFTYSGSNKIDDVAWYCGNSFSNNCHNVATKKANSLGIYDLCGNVKEWCWDYFSYEYYSKSPAKNPKGPDSDVTLSGAVVRGGFYNSKEDYCRVAARASCKKYYGNGIRLVRTIK